MNAGDIQDGLKGRLGSLAYFIGCFPSDFLEGFEIPSLRTKDLILVINTLPLSRREEMGHWFTLVIRRSPLESIFIFDSLGLEPSILSNTLVTFLARNKHMSSFRYSNAVQPLDSSLCAFYAMYFTHRVTTDGLCKGLWSLNKYMTTSNLKLNDHFVLLYYLKYLNSRPCRYIWKHTKPLLSMEICKVLKL